MSAEFYKYPWMTSCNNPIGKGHVPPPAACPVQSFGTPKEWIELIGEEELALSFGRHFSLSISNITHSTSQVMPASSRSEMPIGKMSPTWDL